MSDNNSGKKKTLTGREMHDRIETLLAFLNRNLRGKEEAVNLSLLSAIATENILLLGQPGKDKNLIGRCIASALKDCYNEEWKFCPYEQHAYSESCSDSTNIVFIDDIWSCPSALADNADKDISFNKHNFFLLIAGSSEADPYKAAEERHLEALRECFALHVDVKPIANDNDFFNFVNTSSFNTIVPEPDDEQKDALLTFKEIVEWQPVIDRVELSEEAKKVISEIRRKCFDYYVSDSRWKRIIHILKTCAFLNGRSKVDLIDCLLIDYAIPNRFVEEILKRHAIESKLDGKQHAQYKSNVFTRQKYYEILKASIDDKKLKLEHETKELG